MPCEPAVSAARAGHGLSLIEVMIAVAIAAILSTIAYPGFQSAVLKARRSEALTTFSQLQLAQERHRSNQVSYATLAESGVAVSGGRYRYSEDTPTPRGYSITASAQGGQAADAACRYLRLQVNGVETLFASGADSNVANGEHDNRRCWGQ